MNRENIINALVWLGKDIEANMNSEEYELMYQQARAKNAWFIKENIQYALRAFLPWLNEENLRKFVSKYDVAQHSRTIAVVAAGNIPAVCFHDVLCVLLSGHKLMLKLSSQDDVIVPFLLEKLKQRTEIACQFVDKISHFDAVIATGSNSSSMYFETYFSKYPHIIRKSRSSIAVIETDFPKIEDDIFMYMGLGCRNVSLVFLPQDFDLQQLTKNFASYSHLINHNKYKNNYDYYKSIFLMNSVPFVDCGNLILQEKRELHAPVSVLYYSYYADLQEVRQFIEDHKEELQCVVGDACIPFGKTQQPSLEDFADDVDTMKFLETLP